MRTRGPHFLVAPEAVDGGRAVLSGDDARHLGVVLRARPGDPVSLADGTGALMQARVAHLGEETTLSIVERATVPTSRPALTVVHALPKGRKLDEVVQRLTEVGVDRLVPVHSSRSQVELSAGKAAKAVSRWRAVALAAAKQSRRVRPLVVEDVGDWGGALAELVGRARPGERAVAGAVLWEQATTPLRRVLADIGAADADEVVLAIGPEGGITAEEVEACGLAPASLGETILRTETAALVTASLVLGHLGRLG